MLIVVRPHRTLIPWLLLHYVKLQSSDTQKDRTTSSQKEAAGTRTEWKQCQTVVWLTAIHGHSFVHRVVFASPLGLQLHHPPFYSLSSNLFFCMEFWYALFMKASEKVFHNAGNLVWNEIWKASEMVTSWFTSEMSVLCHCGTTWVLLVEAMS